MIRYAAALGLLLATTAMASGQNLGQQIADFLGAPGYAPQAVTALEDQLDKMWLDTTKVSPGGAIGPIEKAMLIADSAIASTRTRTAIAYGEVIAEDGTPVSFIEVRHYNMAAALHAETVAAYGAENTADVAEFGEGEHKAWRFVFQPLMNNAAILLDASARTIPPEEAATQDCTGRPCLDVTIGFGDVMEWTELDATIPVWRELYPSLLGEMATPAQAIAKIAVLGYWASAEEGSYQWTGGEHPEAARDATPYRFIGIDRNLGQDDGIDSVWQETLLNDDSLVAVAYRYIDIVGQVYLMQSTQPR